MRVIHWREFDVNLFTQISWHTKLDLAVKKARKVGAPIIVHYPADSMREEHWTVVKSR